MKLEDWNMAAGVLEDFRTSHPDHQLHNDATKQLAHIYREDGQLARSAAEHERISAEASDVELSREALLTAGDLYDEADAMADAVRVYEQYVSDYPRPIDYAMETQKRLSEIYKEWADYQRYNQTLSAMVEFDRDAGVDRTDRSRYLAGGAALVLAEQTFQQFAAVELVQPFEASLARKQSKMDESLAALENLVSYEVSDITAAATYMIAETYREFGRSLVESERPAGLSAAEKSSYELVIEEEAWPFEEQAIDVHEANFELLAAGIYNLWIQKSLDELSILMPGRYAKNESSQGFLESIDFFAYRMPVAPEIGVEGEGVADAENPQPENKELIEIAVLAGIVSSH
jgi:tetratricopeptide (TPR) repeat protein